MLHFIPELSLATVNPALSTLVNVQGEGAVDCGTHTGDFWGFNLMR
jgi:hypothetical protein